MLTHGEQHFDECSFFYPYLFFFMTGEMCDKRSETRSPTWEVMHITKRCGVFRCGTIVIIPALYFYIAEQVFSRLLPVHDK